MSFLLLRTLYQRSIYPWDNTLLFPASLNHAIEEDGDEKQQKKNARTRHNAIISIASTWAIVTRLPIKMCFT